MVGPKDFSIGGEKVLVAVDGSESSDLAVEEAIGTAPLCGLIRRRVDACTGTG